MAEQILAHYPVPIILLTGLADPGLAQQAQHAGVAAQATKPVDSRQLEAAIALALRRFKAGPRS